ncbi:MAG: hypothetical protein ACI9W2_002701 [Gammaproteobacteria bacterium]|jgi:hypothetical protein
MVLSGRPFIAQYPTATPAQLSRLVCEQPHWRRPDGRLKDMRWRVAMLRMHRDGRSCPCPRLVPALRLPPRVARDLRRTPPLARNLLPRRPLDPLRTHPGAGELDVQKRADLPKKQTWICPLIQNFRETLCTCPFTPHRHTTPPSPPPPRPDRRRAQTY